MTDKENERLFWINFLVDIEEKLTDLETELMLANPLTHTDDQHQFLIKKVRQFRTTREKIIQRIDELA